jgi:DNA primase
MDGQIKISPSKSLYKKSKGSIGYFTGRGDIYLICPFHKEKWPSCVIHAATSKYYKCYGCGRNGRIRDIVRKYRLTWNQVYPDKCKNFELENPYFSFMME